MITLEKTQNGLSILNKTTKKTICGHSYPTLKGTLVQCRKELKAIFSSKEPITFEFVNKLMNQSNIIHIKIPCDPEYLKMVITSKDPAVLAVKNALENDHLILEDFLITCNTYVNANKITFHNLIIKDFDLLKDNIGPIEKSNHQHGIRYLSFNPYAATTTYAFNEGYELIKACKRSPLIPEVYIDRIARFLGRKTSMKIDFLESINTPSDIVLLIEDLVLKREIIWVYVGFGFLGDDERHANSVLIHRIDDKIHVTVTDPHLLSTSVHASHLKNNKRLAQTQSLMMHELKSFIMSVTEDLIAVKRKCIQDSCAIPSALQIVDDFEDGVCTTYTVFLGAIYLMNRQNTSIYGDYHDDDDDLACFFALLGKDASKVVAIIFFILFFKYRDVRDELCKFLTTTEVDSDNKIETAKRLQIFRVLKCRLNGEPDPEAPKDKEDDDEDKDEDEDDNYYDDSSMEL
jgi:hypothetical protein